MTTRLWCWASERNITKWNECWGRRESTFRPPTRLDFVSSMRMGRDSTTRSARLRKTWKTEASQLRSYYHQRIQLSCWINKHGIQREAADQSEKEDHPGEQPSERNSEKAHIAYLQETHLNDKEHKKLRKMGFTKIFFSSYKSNHKRGVAILISNKFAFEQTYEQKDKEGRLLVRGKIDGTELTLLNIYAPPGSAFSFSQDNIWHNNKSYWRSSNMRRRSQYTVHLQPKLDVSNHQIISTLPKQ